MKTFIKINIFMFAVGLVLTTACEGPMGPKGNETCTQCHNNAVVGEKKMEYEHSTHFEGEAFEEGSRAACAPCHSTQGFHYVVANNTPANAYVVDAATTSFPERLNCTTCHDKIHTSYTIDDFFPLTTTAEIPMAMWGGQKTINFEQENGNLCAKCHQPRPVTGSNGSAINYESLASAPLTTYSLSTISYRTGVHYGTEGAMAAGMGGVEFGTGYSNSKHTTEASCVNCHMAETSASTGGHSFIVNFNGCNVADCHDGGMGASNALYTSTRTSFDTKFAALVQKINALGGGHDILQKDPADNQYHGYIDVFDATANPTGYWKNPANGTPALPAFTNAQFGAIINFQLLANDKSHGIHNWHYMQALLDNTIAAF